MSPTNVILLACGSFNPPTNMHLRMFEIARDHLHRMGNHLVVGGVLSPVHDAYGKKELESSTHRLAMIKLALQDHDWVKLSDWECKQESWSRTKLVLQHHQNQLNALLNTNQNNCYDLNENNAKWIPDNIINGDIGHVQVKLLCGADLLESFAVPGLWSDTEIQDIVGQHGLVVITRSKSNPLEFIYNSDMLTKYMPGQAVKIITESSGDHKIIRSEATGKEVCKEDDNVLKSSRSYSNFEEVMKNDLKHSTSNNLKECKSCDENLIKFIFTKHGIQVISDVETIV
ncbi:unnamed protein product [Phaedon cochleariae]|uniref:Cytidyltransferase-like domain-containing protein n=1 Tax=Phaedon cochleariae TaxID=80249 RepID=A0A9N9SDS2_PHACE|nr:unnamed protein product [Phaedon cochleariae]